MAIRGCWSFDDTTNLTDLNIWAEYAGPVVSSAQARHGTQSLRLTSGGTVAKAGMWAGSTLALGDTFGVAFAYMPSWTIGSPAGPSTSYFVVKFSDASAGHVYLGILNDGNVVVLVGSSELTRSTTPPPFAGYRWSHWEVKLAVHDTAGLVQVKINGTQIINVSGVDTRNGSTGLIDRMVFASQNSSGGAYSYVDDIVLWDDTGSDVADFVGDVGVFYYPPAAAGNYTNWTPNTGANYAAVDETGVPDGETTYVSSGTATTKDSYQTPSVPNGTIKAVVTVITARKDDAGSRSIRPFFRRSSTDYTGTTVDLNDTYTRHVEVWHNDPSDSSDWTGSDFGSSATEIGIEVVS